MNTLTYSTENHEFKYLGRYSHFSEEVKNYFGEISEGMAICHGISLKCIAYAITEALNFGRNGLEELNPNEIEFYYKNMICFICGTVCSVYRADCTDVFEKINAQEYDQALTAYYGKIDNLDLQGHQIYVLIKNIEATNEVWEKYGDDSCIRELVYVYWCEQANGIIDLLDNCLRNLRLGYSSSNSSLQDAFDCSGYKMEVTEEGDFNGFSITDVNDVRAISNMMQLTYTSDIQHFYIWTGKYGDTYFVYSSLKELVAKSKDVHECKVPVYCENYLDDSQPIIFNSTSEN